MELLQPSVLSLLLVTLATSVVTLFTGFGVGTVLMPVMALFFDVKVAIFLTAIVHGCNNLSRIVLYRQAIDWRVIRRFGSVSVVGAFIGSYAQLYLSGDWLKSGVGLFLLLYGAFSLLPRGLNFALPKSMDALGGFLSGLLGGLIGNQGAIRSLYLLQQGLGKEELIASAALIAVLIDVTRIPVYAYTQFHAMEEHAALLALVVCASVAGTLIGGRLLPKVSYDWFKRIVLVAIAALGMLLLMGRI
ncbi:sulfite exporter TauE/SafE family protein [Azotosporobacter soli]|uniref:sulfite exporter TauE/SafE family protein n=1 Tax=Azotosporobacter soli TaxID=3055040 RepID=UPI0031FE76C3